MLEDNGSTAHTKYILDLMSVDKEAYPNVYFIGGRATRLTFLSQQQRSLNLIWALLRSGKIRQGTRVAVIGGGLAGVTAAIAAHLKSAKVTLLERKGDILHLQRGTQLRFIHPNIYDWPLDGSENQFTDLPFLNWGAGMAASVIETLLKQWGQLAGTIENLVNHDVRQIRVLSGGGIRVIAEGPLNLRSRKASFDSKTLHHEGTANFRATFDVVILAVGFGLEQAVASIPFQSYWENDNFARAIIAGPIPRHYLVTGCGDGGLIDAIRLRIRGFDHARFVYDLLSFPGIEETKERLLAIDKEASTRMDREEDLGEFIENEYDSLFFGLPPQIQKELEIKLDEQLRDDTVVFLNGRNSSPFNLSSAILNRVAVFLLLRFGGLRYRPGKLIILHGQSADRVLVGFERYGAENINVHEVVVRHGPSGVIGQLLPDNVVKGLLPIDAMQDYSRTQLYESNFWDSDKLNSINPSVALLVRHQAA